MGELIRLPDLAFLGQVCGLWYDIERLQLNGNHMLALTNFVLNLIQSSFFIRDTTAPPVRNHRIHESSHLHMYIGDSGLAWLTHLYEIKDLQRYHPSLIILS